MEPRLSIRPGEVERSLARRADWEQEVDSMSRRLEVRWQRDEDVAADPELEALRLSANAARLRFAEAMEELAG